MYITPNTDVLILENIPLNKTYEHTVLYPNKDTQYNEFQKYVRYTLHNYSYQRAQLGTLRVELSYEQLINCNYMMFKNTSFENKWFYAFITGIGYVSNHVTEIYYELDVLQTWCYDYTFGQTFVERQHSTNDVPFENTQAEGLELGSDYYTNSVSKLDLFETDRFKFMILATTSPEGEHPTAEVINGVLMSVYSAILKESDAKNTIQQYINNGLESNIIAIYTVPNVSKYYVRTTPSDSLQGYKPRNNKLYCSPFQFMTAYNYNGESLDYKYENFFKPNHGGRIDSVDSEIKFKAETTYFPIPQTKFVPVDYLIQHDGDPYEPSELGCYGVTTSQYPPGAISGDSFKAWLAQNKNSYAAALTSINSTYDTNVAIAQNNYNMAERTANTNAAASINTVQTGLANAQASTNTALAVNAKNEKMSYGVAGAKLVSDVASNVSDLKFGDIAGSAINFGVSMATANIQAENTVNTLNTQLANANASGATAIQNTQMALSTALKNASTSQASAQLSALTTAQNATAALVAKKQDAQHMPSNLHGSLMSECWNAEHGCVGYVIYRKSINREYAERIDAYFDKYGYAQRSMYTPERLNRKHWSYLKTVGCNIFGKLNNADLLTIKGIYDNGVTTWDSLGHVMHYELDNRVGDNNG